MEVMMHKNRLIKVLNRINLFSFPYRNKSCSLFLILLAWLTSVKGDRTLRNSEWIKTQ